jgi:SAM-dependent methyltransferase
VKKNKMDFETYAKIKPMGGKVSNNWRRVFDKHIFNQVKPDTSRVLDYGFGDGKYYRFFSENFKEDNVYGLEISAIRVQRVKDLGWEKVQCLQPKEKFPFEADFFDFINCDQVLEHIQCNEADFYLSEMKRVLTPGGILLFIVPNYPIKRFYDIVNAFRYQKWSKLKDDPTHICYYNFKRLAKVLTKHFEKVDLIPAGGGLFRLFKFNFVSHKIFAVCK